MMGTLKPCPFCGSEDVCVPEREDFNALMLGWSLGVRAECEACGAHGPGFEVKKSDDFDAAHDMAVAAWNARAERTCHPVPTYNDDSPWAVMVCSECGRRLHYDEEEDGTMDYQPYCGCGARVEEVVDGS